MGKRASLRQLSMNPHPPVNTITIIKTTKDPKGNQTINKNQSMFESEIS
jgi:hypothetical protein